MAGQVIGTITDGAGSPAVRTVRAHLRSSGKFLAEAVSAADGTYVLYTPTQDEVQLVALDDDSSPLENDLIARVMPDLRTDPYWSSVVLLLDGEGSITDKSSGARTVSLHGSVGISTDWKSSGDSSIAFTGGYIDCAVPSAGTGPFTIEFRLKANSFSGNPTYLDNRTGGGGAALVLYDDGANAGKLTLFANGANQIVSSAVSTSVSSHVAICKGDDGNLRLFLGGVLQGSVADANSYTSAILRFGANLNGTNPLSGYMDDLEVTYAAKYTASFTPPIGPLATA